MTNNYFNYNKYSKFLFLNFLLLFLSLSLTGCYDKVELEERGLVLSMGIDKNLENNNFLITLSMPDIITSTSSNSNPEDSSSGSSSINQAIKIGEASTISQAINSINIDMIKNLYFGHTKVVLIGEEILKDEALLKQTIDFLERHREISRKVIILGTQNAKTILEAVPNDEKMLGIYINDFYKNNSSYKIDLDYVIQKLLTSGDIAIPSISLSENNLYINNLYIIKNYMLTSMLDENSSKYLLCVLDENTLNNSLTEISIDFNNINTGLVFLNSSINKTISQDLESNKIIINYNISSDVNITEYSLGENILFDDNSNYFKLLEQQAEQFLCEQIKSSINQIWDLNADILDLKQYIYKNNFSLYNQYNLDNSNIYDNILLEVSCNINIKGSGKIK
ncbi:MAG: Ger(x)C family spore germination protein [bacterium]